MSRFAIGVDLGGTRIRAALIDRNGAIFQRAETPTAADADPKLSSINSITLRPRSL
jgi:glucokinase